MNTRPVELILSLGPASSSPDLLRRVTAIATRIRLNIAHFSPAELEEAIKRVHACSSASPRPVVLDLQGAKIRIGRYPAVASPPPTLELVLASESMDAGIVPIPHESVFRQIRPGDHLYFNDKKVIVQVIEKAAPDRLIANTLLGGPLSSGKGINSPDRVFELARVGPADVGAIALGRRFPLVEFAVSFVGDGREAALYRPLTGDRRLTAKIERALAMTHLEVIDAAFDELWLCRGDLGAECGLEHLGHLQAEFVARFPHLTRPKILAGEVLGSMLHSPIPSRSEIVHLHDIFRAGFDGVVLSDETAVGGHVPAVLDFLERFVLRS